MILNDAINEIIDNAKKIPENLDPNIIEDLMDIIINSNNVFVIGLGRSGLVAKAFAMRLMHIGIPVYVIGETITPSMHKDDCLIVISGSGETSYIRSVAKTSKDIGAKVLCVTSYTSSSLAKISDLVVYIGGRTKLEINDDFIHRQMKGSHKSLVPLGTLFEISSLIFLDAVINELMDKLGKTEKDLEGNHSNDILK